MGISVLYVRISSLDGKTDRQRVNEEEFDRVHKIVFAGEGAELKKVSAEEIAKHKKRIIEEATTHLLN